MCILSSISASIGGIFLKIVTLHSPRIRHKQLKFGCDMSLHKGTLLRNYLFLQLYLILHWRDFPANSYSEPSMHALQMVQTLLWMVNNWRAMYIFCCISATLGGIFLKLSILNSHVLKYCHFGSNRSLTKGTLLGQQCVVWLCTSSILNPGGARFSTSIHISPGAHPASYIMCNTSLSWG